MVKVGQQVERAQVIGRQGSTGKSTGSHLHYEIRKKHTPSFGWSADSDSVYNPTEYLNNYYELKEVKPAKVAPAVGYKDSDVITYGDLKKLGLIK
jgi:murein DD-endopeptidase MepM/ murein hydrolase activator NlpD